MANASYFDTQDTLLKIDPVSTRVYYAVYDSCVSNNVPGFDLAFIEERSYVRPKDPASGELYFNTLREAKIYVKKQFKSGGHYFSLNQTENPDDFLQILVDKVTYLIA